MLFSTFLVVIALSFKNKDGTYAEVTGVHTKWVNGDSCHRHGRSSSQHTVMGKQQTIEKFSATRTSDAAWDADNSDEQRMNMQALSHDHFEFALAVYRALLKLSDPTDNLVYSPILLADILTKVLVTVENKQGDQRSLHESEDYATDEGQAEDPKEDDRAEEVLLRQLREVLHYGNASAATLHRAHSLMKEGLSSQYYRGALRHCTRYYCHGGGASQGSLSYNTDNASESSRAIDSWINNCTGRRDKFSLSAAAAVGSRCVVKGGGRLSSNWKQDFNRSLTFDKGLFYTTGGRREIPVMVGRQLVPLGYSRELEVRVLELPFRQRRASLYLLLPDHPQQGLKNLEKNLTAGTVRSILATLQDETVNIRLPRFKVISSPPLLAALQILGVTELFGGYEGQTNASITITNIIYKMAFEVQEEGQFQRTNAQTQTEKRLNFSSHPAIEKATSKASPASTFGEKHFQVDHPFLFFVWDYVRSYVVLMGRVMNPNAIGDTLHSSESSYKLPIR